MQSKVAEHSSRNIKRGVLLSYLSLFIGVCCSLVYSHYATSFLSTEQYGLFTTGTALMGYLSLLTFGLSGTIIKFASEYIAKKQKKEEASLYGFFLIVFTGIAILAFLIGLVVIMFEPRIFKTAGSTEDKQLRIIILMMLINLCISFPCSVFNSVICSYEKFVYLKVVNIVISLSTSLTVVPLLFLGKQAVEITFVIQMIHILANISYIIFSLFRLKIKISFNLKIIDKSVYRDIFTFAFFIFIGSLCDQLYWNTDKFILSIFVGQTAVAVYGLGAMFHSYFQQFSGSISEVLFPSIIKNISLGQNEKESSAAFIKISRVITIVLMFILSGFILFGKKFIFYFTGGKEAYNESYYIALLVLIPATIPLSQSAAFLIIKALGKHKFRAILYLCIAIINALVSIPLGIKFGGIGCAATTCVCALIGHGLIMNIYYQKKIHLDIKQYWSEFFKILIPVLLYSVIAYCFITKFTIFNIYHLGIEIVVYSIGFIALTYFMILNVFEKENVKLFFRKFKKNK